MRPIDDASASSRALERVRRVHATLTPHTAPPRDDAVVSTSSNAAAALLVVVFGGIVLDVHATPTAPGALARGTSAPGVARVSVGGVGMNVATAARASGDGRVDVELVSAVGDDDDDGARAAREANARGLVDVARTVRVARDRRTARVVGIVDGGGELAACVADVDVVEDGADAAWCASFARDVAASARVVVDANLGRDAIRAVVSTARACGVPVWYEPVSVGKATRILSEDADDDARPLAGMAWCSPNAAELRELANGVRRRWAKGSPMSPCPFNPEFAFDTAGDALDALASDVATLLAAGCERVALTLGALGAVVSWAPRGDVSQAMHAHVPAYPVTPVSLVGAGDAFVGGTVSALARGSDALDAAARGAACASLACERVDAALTNVDEREIARRAAVVRRGVTLLTPAVRQ